MVGNIVRHYAAVPRSVKAAFWGTFANFFQKGVVFLSIPVFTHIMNASEMGLFNVYNALAAAAYVFATFNVAWDVVQNGLIANQDDRDRYLSAMVGLTNVLGLVCAGVYIVAPGLWDGLLGLPRSLSIALLVQVLATPALDLWLARQRAEYRYRAQLAVSLGLALTTPLVAIWAVKTFTPHAEARVISSVVVLAVVCLPLWALLVKRGRSLYVWRYWKYALVIAIPLLPYYLSRALINQFDRVVIGSSLGLAAAGVYGVAYSAATIVYVLGLSINQILLPWAYRQMRSGSLKRLRRVYLLTGLLVGLGSLVGATFAPQVLSLLGPDEYGAGAIVFGIVSISAFLSFVALIFTNILLYFEQSRTVSSIALLAAVCNVGLNLLLVPSFGYVAAAWVTLFSAFVMATGSLYAAKVACLRRGLEWPFGRFVAVFLCVGVTAWCSVGLLLYETSWIGVVYVGISMFAALFPALRLGRDALSVERSV